MKNLLTFFFLTLYISSQAQNPQNSTWYRIESGQNKKNISNNNSNTTATVIVSKSSVSREGHWMFERIFDNTSVKKYRLRNRVSGMYIANFQQTKSGTEVKQTKSPGEGAVWRLKELQGDYIQIISNHSGMYLGLSGQEDGATLMQTSTGSNTTTWKLIPVGFENGSSNASSNVNTSSKNTNNSVSISTTKYFEFINDMSLRSLTNNGKNNSGTAVIAKKDAGVGEHWKFISAGDGNYRIQNKNSGLYITNRSSKSSGDAIFQTNTQDEGTLWKLEKIGGDKYYIVNNQSGMYLSTSGTHSGATVTQTASKSSNTTAWTLKEL
jgi:hypothetical protein